MGNSRYFAEMASTNQIVLQCNSDAGRRRRLSEEAIKSESGEVRGVVILVVCGLYAISLFIMAKLLSCLLGSITTSVRSMLFGVKLQSITQGTDIILPQQTPVHPLMRKTLQIRALNHG